MPFKVLSGPAGLGRTATGTAYKGLSFRVLSGPAGSGRTAPRLPAGRLAILIGIALRDLHEPGRGRELRSDTDSLHHLVLIADAGGFVPAPDGVLIVPADREPAFRRPQLLFPVRGEEELLIDTIQTPHLGFGSSPGRGGP